MGLYLTTPDDALASTPETPYPLLEKEVSGHRFYMPETGRWASRDPIGSLDPLRMLLELSRRQKPTILQTVMLKLDQIDDLEEEKTIYLFGSNNPLNRFDLLGLKSDFAKTCDPGWVWGPKDPVFAVIPPANGCSTPPLVPTDYDGCEFTPACNNHDYCYSDCDKSHKDCDKNLRKDMKAACDSCASKRTFPDDKAKQKWLKGCKKWGDIYYAAVEAFGTGPYGDRQKQACGCKCDISYFLP